MKKQKFFKKRLIWRLKVVFIITLMVMNLSVFGILGYRYLFTIQPAFAQRISPSNLWMLVYQQLPNFPKENKYISKETGKVDEDNTLAGRLINYHVYVKGRSPGYRFDWKLTLADYLNANETIYEGAYPGSDTLRKNPLDGDRAAIAKLTRDQRNELVQVMVNIFTSPGFNVPHNMTAPVPGQTKTP
jgi:hypothetical protein